MKDIIQVSDKQFRPYIPHEKIQAATARVAAEINRDLDGKAPIFVCVLNGAFMFASDLFRQITIRDAQITFVRMKSYEGTKSTGHVSTLSNLMDSIVDRTVVVVEDICDTGYTLERLKKQLYDLGAESVHVAVLFNKVEARLVKDLTIDYSALEIANQFIVGYGLDYNEVGRNLPDIYILDEPEA